MTFRTRLTALVLVSLLPGPRLLADGQSTHVLARDTTARTWSAGDPVTLNGIELVTEDGHPLFVSGPNRFGRSTKVTYPHSQDPEMIALDTPGWVFVPAGQRNIRGGAMITTFAGSARPESLGMVWIQQTADLEHYVFLVKVGDDDLEFAPAWKDTPNPAVPPFKLKKRQHWMVHFEVRLTAPGACKVSRVEVFSLAELAKSGKYRDWHTRVRWILGTVAMLKDGSIPLPTQLRAATMHVLGAVVGVFSVEYPQPIAFTDRMTGVTEYGRMIDDQNDCAKVVFGPHAGTSEQAHVRFPAESNGGPPPPADSMTLYSGWVFVGSGVTITTTSIRATVDVNVTARSMVVEIDGGTHRIYILSDGTPRRLWVRTDTAEHDDWYIKDHWVSVDASGRISAATPVEDNEERQLFVAYVRAQADAVQPCP